MSIKSFHIWLWVALFGLLMVPAVAMPFTDEVQWTFFDFVFGALMLGGLGLVLEWILSKFSGGKRWVSLFVTICVFILAWMFLATRT